MLLLSTIKESDFMNIFFIILAILVIYCILAYNYLIKLKNYVKEAFSTMDVYLKKRWDLVPNLVEVVKQYALHEKTVFNNITELRAKSYSEMNTKEKLDTNKQLSQDLAQILAIAENYPDLKANKNFSELSSQLVNIEDDIANARKYYNGTTRDFNTFVEMFPSNIIANIFGFKEEPMFEVEDSQRENVQINFEDK